MADTREPPYTDLGVWAENATLTPLPPFPDTGVAYRNDTLTQVQNETGELWNSIPDSANFNQQMYIITKFITDINHHGTVGWSDQVDYIARPPTNVLAAITWADDGAFYEAVQESGPGTGAGVQDPALDIGAVYWEKITSASTLLFDLANQTPGDEGARLVGTTYQPDPSLPLVGRTVQANIDELNIRAWQLQGFRVKLSASFDDNGNMLGAGFNVKDNIAEKKSSHGINYFSIKTADGTDVFNTSYRIQLTAFRETNPSDPSNLLTSYSQTIVGPWRSLDNSIIIDPDLESIKIIFTDPYNINITQYPPFSIMISYYVPNQFFPT